jgi:2-amino-4-hydroxy-6-hydroxymethyldihydropteridine diphosphokinase
MIRVAIRDLRGLFGPVVVSPVYRTPATGFVGDDFYNLIAGFRTILSLPELRRTLRQIEADNGRVRTAEKFCARTLDIDVMLYGKHMSEGEGKPIPSPEILEYPFVLKPLADIAPDEKHPEQDVSYQKLWDDFAGDKQGLQQIPFTFEE